MDTQKILDMLSSSKDTALAAAVRHENLVAAHNAQMEVLNDLSGSLPPYEETMEKIQKNKEIAEKLDIQIAATQAKIFEILTQQNVSIRADEMLSGHMLALQHALFTLCDEAAERGHSAASIHDVIALEKRLSDTIDALADAGQYPQTPEVAEERKSIVKQHNEKVSTFIGQDSGSGEDSHEEDFQGEEEYDEDNDHGMYI